MKQEVCKALFTAAGIPVLKMWELPNDYWPRVEAYRELREKSPWWLVKTNAGLIEIGWRKRVISIDWSETNVRGEVTTDSVTKSDVMVHAWNEADAVKYLSALRAIPVRPEAPVAHVLYGTWRACVTK